MIKTQKDVNNLKHTELNNQNSKMIKVNGIKHLFIKIQKSTKTISISYVFRRTIQNKNKCISLGTSKDISLKEAKTIAKRLNNQIIEQRISSTNSISNLCTCNVTIQELFKMYTNAHNLKPASEKTYRTVIFNYCKSIQNLPISSISPKLLNQNLSINTLKQYTNILNILFKWAKIKKIIDYNPFYGLSSTYNNIHVQHRKALTCENFDTINIAKSEVKNFLQALLSNNDLNVFIIWIIHLILGTRVTETYRVLSSYQSTNEYVTIEVKSTKNGAEPNFRVPISKDIKNLIIYIQPLIKKLSPSYFPKYLNHSIPQEYKGKISAHGSRSIFRTVIELITPKNISFEAKEFYLAHKPLTTIQATYNRTDYFKERTTIQEIYAKWIFSCLSKDGLKLLTNALNK